MGGEDEEQGNEANEGAQGHSQWGAQEGSKKGGKMTSSSLDMLSLRIIGTETPLGLELGEQGWGWRELGSLECKLGVGAGGRKETSRDSAKGEEKRTKGRPWGAPVSGAGRAKARQRDGEEGPGRQDTVGARKGTASRGSWPAMPHATKTATRIP